MEGGDEQGEEGEDEDDTNRDPNIIRENKRRKKEQLHFEQVDVCMYRVFPYRASK